MEGAKFLFLFFADRPDEFVFDPEEKRRVRRDHLGSVERREQRKEMQSDAQLFDGRARAHAKSVLQEQQESDEETKSESRQRV